MADDKTPIPRERALVPYNAVKLRKVAARLKRYRTERERERQVSDATDFLGGGIMAGLLGAGMVASGNSDKGLSPNILGAIGMGIAGAANNSLRTATEDAVRLALEHALEEGREDVLDAVIGVGERLRVLLETIGVPFESLEGDGLERVMGAAATVAVAQEAKIAKSQ